MSPPTYRSITYPAFSSGLNPSITEHNGKLYAALDGHVQLLCSSDSITWEPLEAMQFPQVMQGPKLASFKGSLWCGYTMPSEHPQGNFTAFLVYNETKGKWEEPNFLHLPNSAGSLLDMIVFNDALYFFSLSGFHWSDFRFNYTSDGISWKWGDGTTNKGFNDIIGCEAAIFQGDLYLIFSYFTDVWEMSIQELNETNYQFQEVDHIKTQNGLKEVGLSGYGSLANSNAGMWLVQPDANSNKLSYQVTNDPSLNNWNSLPEHVMTNYPFGSAGSGTIFQDSFFLVNLSTAPGSEDKLFSIITTKDVAQLLPPPFVEQTIILKPKGSPAFNVTTICPPIKVNAYTANFVLAKDDSENYYMVSTSQDEGRKPAYYSFTQKPSPMIAHENPTWIAYGLKNSDGTSNTICILAPGAPADYQNIPLDSTSLFPPVPGGSANQLITQDTTGKLFVATISSDTSYLKLTPTTYQLATCGPVGPFAAEGYLYLYDQQTDVINIFDMATTTDYSTPVASTAKIDMDSIQAGTEVDISATEMHIVYVARTGETAQIRQIPKYQTGASNLKHKAFDIKTLTVTTIPT